MLVETAASPRRRPHGYCFDVDRNSVEFKLAPRDVSAIRFGVSPSHEACHAIRLLISPQDAPLQTRWLRERSRHLPPATLDFLGLLIGESGYMPDFLTSAPTWDRLPEDEITRLRNTHLAGVRTDLRKRADRAHGRRKAALHSLADNPRQTRAKALAAYTEAWDTLMAQQWPQMLSMLRSDISVRLRHLTMHGLGRMVESLHHRVVWRDDSVQVTLDQHSEVLDCRGRGLVLAPSVISHRCTVLTEPPAQPTLYYPALGISDAWDRADLEPASTLAALLGSGRARVILALAQPLSTSAVAVAAGISISTASHHVSVLRTSGLLESRRDGTSMMHVLTPLGESLVNARAHPA